MHDRISVNALAFAGDPIETVMDHLRELAPRRVSFYTQQLVGDGLAVAKRDIAEAGYRVETITHPFTTEQLSDKAIWGPAREGLSQAVKAATAIGAKSIYMLTGGRGPLTWEEAAEAFAEAIAPGRAEAKAAGIELMIETGPALYVDRHLAHNLRDTLLLAEIAEIGVCLDLFSVWTEAGLKETITRAAPRIGLVQVGDYIFGDRFVPSRAVVGEGSMPMQRLISWVLETGYEGAFDLEMIGPRVDEIGPVEALRRSAEKTSEILEALGA